LLLFNKTLTMTVMLPLVRLVKFGKLLELEQSSEEKKLLKLTKWVAHGKKLMEDSSRFLSEIGILGVLLSSMRLSEDLVSLDRTQPVQPGSRFQDL